MSIPVSMQQLAATLTAFEHAYLITMRPAGGFAKIYTVDPVVTDGELLIPTDHQASLDNVTADPRITLIWPPLVHHGWTLLVDGHGSAVPGGIQVAVDHGMLHRPREHGDGPEWVFPESK